MENIFIFYIYQNLFDKCNNYELKKFIHLEIT